MQRAIYTLRNWIICLALLLTIISGQAASIELYDERLIVPFDGRHWVAAHAAASEDGFVVEYILRGEQVESWTELVTTVRLPVKPDTGILQWSRNFYKKRVLKNCDKANFSDLDSSDSYQLFSFDQERCFKPAKREYSIGCFIKGIEGVHLLLYAARNQKTYERNFPIWYDLMKSAKAFSPPRGANGPTNFNLADLTKMIQLTYRHMNGDGRTVAWDGVSTRMWRSGMVRFRAEEAVDPVRNLQLLSISDEPDIWRINLAENRGFHMLDPSMPYETHCPAFGEPKEDGLTSCEFGGEIDFFKYHGARQIDEESVRGVWCDVFELPRLYWILRLYVRKDTHVPLLMTRRGPDGIVQSVCYDLYLENLPFDGDLFKPPKSVVITEASQGSSKR